MCVSDTIHCHSFVVFFFNDTATTEIYTLSLHDALPILLARLLLVVHIGARQLVVFLLGRAGDLDGLRVLDAVEAVDADRKSTRLNSSHQIISYSVFCLKKKNTFRNMRLSHLMIAY